MGKSAKLNGIERFLRGEKGQRFFNFAYSIGAAIVIWGALFKILHLPGGSTLLCIGMGTEIAMFILTAFDRPSKEYAWEQVFPELDHHEHDAERPKRKRKKRGEEIPMDENAESVMPEADEGSEEYQERIAAEGFDDEPIMAYPGRYYGGVDYATGGKAPEGVSTEFAGEASEARQTQGGTAGGGGVVIQGGAVVAGPAGGFADIAPEDAASLRESISKMAAAAEQLSQMADLTTATQDYLSRIAGIADQMSQLQETTSELNKVSSVLLDSYRAITDNSASISESSSGYVESMADLNRNISGLNTIYEIQLKSISSQLESIDRVNRGLKDIRDMYEKSARQSSRYCEETERMTRYMTQLNSVYEKMVTAMTINMYNPMMGNPAQNRRDEFNPFEDQSNNEINETR